MRTELDSAFLPNSRTAPSGQLWLPAAAGAMLLAGGWVLTSWLSLDPLWAATLRVLPAGLLLLAIKPARPDMVWCQRSVALGIVNFGAFFTLQALAVRHVSPGVAATIAATQTLFVPFGARSLLQQTVRPHHVVLAVVGLTGIAMLLLPNGTTLDVVGGCASVGTAACTAIGLVLTTYWGRPAGVHHMSSTGWQMTAGGLILLPCALLTRELPTLDWHAVSIVATTSILGTAIAFSSIFGALHAGLPASVVSRLMLLCPVAVSLTDLLLRRQDPSALRLVGFGLVLISVAATTIRVR